MPKKKTKEQIKQNMSHVRNRDTQLENALCDALNHVFSIAHENMPTVMRPLIHPKR